MTEENNLSEEAKTALQEELAGLEKKSLKKNGEPRKDAKQDAIDRIKAIKEVLGIEDTFPADAKVTAPRKTVVLNVQGKQIEKSI